jgi:hypothetical protein
MQPLKANKFRPSLLLTNRIALAGALLVTIPALVVVWANARPRSLQQFLAGEAITLAAGAVIAILVIDTWQVKARRRELDATRTALGTELRITTPAAEIIYIIAEFLLPSNFIIKRGECLTRSDPSEPAALSYWRELYHGPRTGPIQLSAHLLALDPKEVSSRIGAHEAIEMATLVRARLVEIQGQLVAAERLPVDVFPSSRHEVFRIITAWSDIGQTQDRVPINPLWSVGGGTTMKRRNPEWQRYVTVWHLVATCWSTLISVAATFTEMTAFLDDQSSDSMLQRFAWRVWTRYEERPGLRGKVGRALALRLDGTLASFLNAEPTEDWLSLALGSSSYSDYS